MNYQEKFNEVLEKNLPEHLSLAQELCEILEVSLDSAYRRLRNQTDYSIAEAMKISEHFNIPLEALNAKMGTVATFKVNHMMNEIESYKGYLKNMLDNLDTMIHFKDATMYYAAEDIPVFYHYEHEALGKFKIIYWLKSLMNVKDYQYKSVESIELDPEILEMASMVSDRFAKISTVEIWTDETVLSTLKQVKYYWDAGFFETKEMALKVLDDLILSLESINRNVETGYKFHNGSMTSTKQEFYLSDVMIGNNSVFVKGEDFQVSFISYSTFNFMQTNNTHFNRQNEKWLQTIMYKATLLSGVAEKQRNQFFKSMIRKVRKMKEYVLESE